MNKILLAGVACLSFSAAAAVQAQPAESTTTTTVVREKKSGTEGGAATGAIAGAVVAGPIGAVIGAGVGAVVGHTVAPPTEVRTYITTQNAAPVIYSDEIVVGRPIEGEIAWLDVPRYPKYRWAYLNGQRVVIETDSHNVVAVYR
jgi:hypothetical protein